MTRLTPIRFLCALLTLAALGAAAQRREFLTPDEIFQVREAQEPADRMKLYVEFARARLDRIDKEMLKPSADRAAMIHDLLQQYDQIIDAIDNVAELGQAKRALLRKGLDAAVRAEPEFIKRLKDLEAKNPKDLEEFRFMLQQAIETTEDSLEELKEQYSKLPADKKEEKRLEKEAQKEERERLKNEPVKKKK
jgi:hypothetical protein